MKTTLSIVLAACVLVPSVALARDSQPAAREAGRAGHREAPSVRSGTGHSRSQGSWQGHRGYDYVRSYRGAGYGVGIGGYGYYPPAYGYGYYAPAYSYGYYPGYGAGYPYSVGGYYGGAGDGYYGSRYYSSGSGATTGLLLGALAGGIIGNNSGDFRHNGWRGAAWGAGVGWLLGSVADANRRTAVYQPYPPAATVTPQPSYAAPVQSAPPAATPSPQQITIINNYYGTPSPMSGANSLFGR